MAKKEVKPNKKMPKNSMEFKNASKNKRMFKIKHSVIIIRLLFTSFS